MTTTTRDRLLRHLEALVACDTRNPPRSGQGIDGLFAHVRAALPEGFDVVERDLGDGCRWLHARRVVDGADPREVAVGYVKYSTLQ